MMDHNIRFKGVIWKIIPKLYVLPLFIWSIGPTCQIRKSVFETRGEKKNEKLQVQACFIILTDKLPFEVLFA